LRIEVEGHTDSVGSDAYNQRLSEQRAESVRDYLLSQGLKGDILTAKGFGETSPVASNDTASGRQQNRRVELVVSGEVIGTKLSDIRGTTPSTVPPPVTQQR
jgi:outer membrane protein OmpA-like peptidoglycan-associated protein